VRYIIHRCNVNLSTSLSVLDSLTQAAVDIHPSSLRRSLRLQPDRPCRPFAVGDSFKDFGIRRFDLFLQSRVTIVLNVLA